MENSGSTRSRVGQPSRFTTLYSVARYRSAEMQMLMDTMFSSFAMVAGALTYSRGSRRQAYPEYSAQYGDRVDEATAAYLELTAGETQEATLVSEYLSVEIDTLAERAAAYENFLARYPDFPVKDTVRIYFNGTVSKLSFPSQFDNLVDAQGLVVTDLMVVYERLSQREDCPVLQELGQSMLEFVAAQPDGVVSDGYDMTLLSENASAVYARAQQTADELYGTLSQA